MMIKAMAKVQRQVAAAALLLTWAIVASAEQSPLQMVEYRLAQAKSAPLEAETALMALLSRARQAPPDQADRVWLQRLQSYQSKTLVAGEHGSEDLDALFPIANSARGLINRLDRDQVRSIAAELIDDPDRYYDALGATARQRSGFLDAALDATPEQRTALRAAAVPRLSDTGVADLAGELALHDQADPALLKAAILYAGPVPALHWLGLARAELGDKAAMEVFGVAQSRADLYSAAQLHAAQSAHLDPGLRARWLSQLADPLTGGSAAMALAKSMDSELAGVLVAKARSSGDPLVRKRLLLALSQSTYKRGGAVTSLRGDPAFLALLDEETRAWFVK